MTTKGCPYDCEFCSIKFSSGHKIRMKPIEQVVDEIRDLEAYNKGVFRKSYQFVDDNLYINRTYTIKLFKAIKDLNILWHGQGTLNTALDDEVLDLMAESGCRSYSIGFESISEASLKEANKTKSNKVSEYKLAADNLTRRGIVPGGFFIFGFDSDDRTVFKRTRDFIVSNHILNPLFSILTPYPGTRVYERVEHRIFDHKWAHYGAIKCVFTPEQMTAEELNAGSFWASQEIADMKNIRRQLEYFWGQGPWKNNPRLRFRERTILRAIGRRLKNPEYNEFLRWATKQKNAVDMFMILSAMCFNDMARKNLPKGRDPATDEDWAKARKQDPAKNPEADPAEG
jgi:radical SAM superfamily enzyme YgiQ (UPF0313 family)